MASRQGRSNRIYNWHAAPWQIDCRVTIAGSGAPTLVTSSTITGSVPTATTMQSQGIKSITRLSTGIYRIQLDDNYTSLLQFDAKFTAGVGGTINMGSLSTGTVYQILTLGTSTQAQFVAAGMPAGITAAPGVVFKAAGAGAGNGTVKLLVANAVGKTEILGTPDLMLNNQPFTQGNGGGYITFQCLAQTPAGTNDGATPPIFTGAAPVAADPTSGSTMYLRFLLSNSSVG